mmetsp:Transcript_71088/g.224526  ORF Transcript_71088/g.224526 Transcript_71088/m.224526 type:complete len:355 (+) Transcript_71088:1255-2319(+)
MGVELLKEPRKEGEDAILAPVLQGVELRHELLDALRLEARLGLGLGGHVHARHERLGEGVIVALHLVPLTGRAVDPRQGYVGVPGLECLELCLQHCLPLLNLLRKGIVLGVGAVRRAELRLAALGVRHVDHPAAQVRDDSLELRQRPALGLRARDARQALGQRPGGRQRGRQQLEAVLVCLEQAHEVTQALRGDVLVHHGVAFGLQGVAPDAGGDALQVQRDLLQALPQRLRDLRVLQEELHGVLPLPDLGSVAERGAEPLLQEPAAEGRAGVVQEVQQGTFVGALKGLQHLEGGERSCVQDHALAHRAWPSGVGRHTAGAAEPVKHIPNGEGQDPLAQQSRLQVLHGPGHGHG